jgi:hypothetical protein
VQLRNGPLGLRLSGPTPWRLAAPVFLANSTVTFSLEFTMSTLESLVITATGSASANNAAAIFGGLPYRTPILASVRVTTQCS